MSEHGSFVTQYIHCEQCFEAAHTILLKQNKELCSSLIWSWQPAVDPMPIIAGKVGGLGSGDELITFEFDLNEQLAKLICHPLRIAVLAETGERIFTVVPNKII